MNFYSIDIENFRGIKSLKIDDFKTINLFVGKNNSGKTSILEALFLSIGISNPQLSINIDTFRNILHNDADDFKFIFYNLDFNNKIKLKTELINSSQFRELEILPNYKKENIINVKDSGSQSSSTSHNIKSDIAGLDFNFTIKKLLKSNGSSYKSSLIFKNLPNIVPSKGYSESLEGVFLRPNTTQGSLYERLDKIIQAKEEEKFVSVLQQFDKRIKRISLGAGNMVYVDIGLNSLVPIHLMGDGIIKFLTFLVNIAVYKNGVLLIDEIENGIHYSVLDLMWKSIYDAAIMYNVQVFATTHSFECVTTFSNIYSEVLLNEDKLRLYRIENLKDEIKVIKYNSDVLKTSIDSNWEVR